MISDQSNHITFSNPVSDWSLSNCYAAHAQTKKCVVLPPCFAFFFFFLIKYLLHTHYIPAIMLGARDQVVNKTAFEEQMHGEFGGLTKPHGILQKWITERGNWLTKMKLQQRTEK